jgi:alkylated DNA repair protein alkB family protein 1
MVGLFIYPSLLPQEVQLQLLAKSFHRDLSNQQHQTNVHMFHHVTYPPDHESYFATSANELVFEPKDPAVHKLITIQQYLTKKLRWITLGGQYDWTNKVYPDGPPPAFPPDIKDLVESLFPMKAEAAIVNLYSPGDTLSLHRDVSEECDQPLASISLGCDGIFVIGLDGAEPGEAARVATLRLRSGDAVLMSGESRYAWHSVPKILEGTCPTWMQHWPGSEWQQWDRWMERKRINLNVRQMFD